MPARPPPSKLRTVNRAVTIELELLVDGDDVQGHATDGTGSRRDFTGWLGLIAALDALLGDAAPTPPPCATELGETTP
jgi:hypothetical protein